MTPAWFSVRPGAIVPVVTAQVYGGLRLQPRVAEVCKAGLECRRAKSSRSSTSDRIR